MSELVDALEHELQRLEYRIKLINNLLADIRSDAVLVDAPQHCTQATEPPAKNTNGSKRDRVKKAVIEYLRSKHQSVHRTEILKHLQDQALLGSEKNPLQNLAIYLTEWRDELTTDGQGNWALKEPEYGGRHQTN